ncbi:MAG TPA: BTAD domain-containing putative transcriptional regulator [Gemmatimonadaceae bacterium]|nr:BTAD domain-containing putative transcriptional regulator [Gemmatimonadaceae bacterium]
MPSIPSVSLRCFGGVALEREGAAISGRATQRRRLALLTLLAASPGRPVSRDKLVAYLWPESDAEAARHLLAGAVYELRKAIGDGALVSRGDDLLLDTAAIRSDIAELEAALSSGAPEAAVALYRGPFADGFHVTGAPEYDRWLEATRERYRQSYRHALMALGDQRTAARDAQGAADAWLSLAADDLADGRAVLSAMHALQATGSGAAALRLAESYARYVRAEFGAEPAAEVAALAAQLRREPASPSPAPASPSEVRAADGEVAEVAAAGPRGPPPDFNMRLGGAFSVTEALRDGPNPRDPRTEAGGEQLVRPAAMTRAGDRRAPRALWLAGVAGAILVSAVLALAASRYDTGGDGAPRAAPAPALPERDILRVVVLPFAVAGGPAHDYLREAVADLLSTGLDGAGRLRTVRPEAAASAAAALYVTGTVHEAAGRLRVRAALHERAKGDGAEPIATATAEGDSGRLFDLVDALAAQLLTAWPADPAGRLGRAAARTTSSLPALKAFLAGEHALRAGRMTAAAEAFGRAVAADSAFALAHYRLSMATLAADLPGAQAALADERALRYSDRLSEHEQILVRAYVAFRKADTETAEQLYRGLTAVYPDDVEAWRQLGETYFHYNSVRGRSIAEAREPFERAMAGDPEDWDALWHLAQLAASDGRRADALRLLDRLLVLRPESAQVLEVRALRAFARGDRAEESALSASLARTDVLRLHQIVWRSAVYLRDLDGAERVARLLAGVRSDGYARWIGYQDLAFLHLARGQWRAADADLAAATSTAGSLRVWDSLILRSIFSAVSVPARPLPELAMLRDSVRASLRDSLRDIPRERVTEDVPSFRARTRGRQRYALGLLSAALGDTAAALARAAELSGADDDDVVRAAVLRAQAARARGDGAGALRELRAVWAQRFFGLALTSPELSLTAERFLRAEALREAGREREALGWYAGFGEHAVHDLPYLGPSLLRRAELHERLGEPERAAEHYERFAALWRDCDPELRPLVERARGRLAALRRR